MIGLITSTTEEGKKIVRGIKNPCASVLPHFRIRCGQIYNKEVAYAVSGMGKTNAAHAATILLEKYSPELIILFGIGGAYPSSGLEVGDVVIAEKEIYGDEGVLLDDGFHDTEFIGIPFLKKSNKKYFNEYPLDMKLAAKVIDSLQATFCASRFTLKYGYFITVSTCTGTRKRALELEKRHNAICENMEGAAVAQVCAIYGVPLLEIRGISNIAEDRDKGNWDLKLAADNCQKAVTAIIKRL